MQYQKIMNAKGELVEAPALLNDRELAVTERMTNALSTDFGYAVDITTLTAILRVVSEQKFYQIPIADYMPVKVDTNTAWAEELLAFRSFVVGGQFEKGYVKSGEEGRLASTDAAVSAIRAPIRTWAKELSWAIPQIGEASRTGVWDIVEAKERSRKTNWDLGIQRVAFLGSSDGVMTGALNMPGVTIKTEILPAPIAQLSTEQLNALPGNMLAAYQINSNYTAYPDFLWVPQEDYNALATYDTQYRNKTRLEVLQDAFRITTRNPNFQILPLAYASAAQSDGVLATNRYVLGRNDENSFRFEIPVDYTVTVANTIEGWTFRNVGFGQHSSVLPLRPQEFLYIDVTPAQG